jgi:serine/threonine-protein kinase HipA
LGLAVAAAAGITVAGNRLLSLGNQSVAVITRFDRDGGQRIPFLSANTLLGLAPGDSGTYTALADGIRQFGDNVAADLREMWRRMVFSLLASNYDDHLRNHGFLMREAGRWSLSPAYDINPVPEIDRSRMNKTPISEESGEPGIEEALAVAGRFRLKTDAAKAILEDAVTAVSNWRNIGRKLGLRAVVLDSYESAFANPRIAEARHLMGK